MKPSLIVFCLCISLISFTINSIAAAQDDAKEAFDRGTKLFSEKRYNEAADEFTRAYKAKPAWKLLYNIAQAQAGARRYGLALETFEKYLAQAGDEISEERLEEILEEIRKLRDMVGDVTISGPDGAVVLVDDIERGTLPMTGGVAVSAGIDHTFVVKQGDRVLFTRVLRLRGGAQDHLVVENAAESPESTAVPPSDSTTPPDDATSDADAKKSDDGPVMPPAPQLEPGTNAQESENAPAAGTKAGSAKLKQTGFVFLTLGGLTLAGGLVAGGIGIHKENELADKCDNLDCIGGGTASIEESRDRAALAADVLFISGAALAVTGIVLLAVHKKRERLQMNGKLSFTAHPAAVFLGGTF